MTHPTSSRTTRALRPALLAAACTLALGACSSSDDDMPDTTPNPVAPDDGDGGMPDAPTDTAAPGMPDAPSDTVAPGMPDAPSDTAAPGMPDITPDPVAFDGTRYAFVASALAGSGQIERLTLGDEITSSGTTVATTTDIRVATDGTDVYEIGRFNLDRLTRFRVDELMTPVWQYSVNGDESTVNPYEIVFASETKAYVVRYGSPFVWIVDPTAETGEAFMTGQIDLSAYNGNTANGDMTPNPSDAVLVDDRLYVLMENLVGLRTVSSLSRRATSRSSTRRPTPRSTPTRRATDCPASRSRRGTPAACSIRRTATSSTSSAAVQHLRRVQPASGRSLRRGHRDDRHRELRGDPCCSTTERWTTTKASSRDALVVSPSKGLRGDLCRKRNGHAALVQSADRHARRRRCRRAREQGHLHALALGPEGRVWVGLNVADENTTDRGFLLLDPSDDSVVEALVPTEFNPLDIVFVDAPTATGN